MLSEDKILVQKMSTSFDEKKQDAVSGL